MQERKYVSSVGTDGSRGEELVSEMPRSREPHVCMSTERPTPKKAARECAWSQPKPRGGQGDKDMAFKSRG